MTHFFPYILTFLIAGIALIVLLTTKYKVPAFFALFFACLFVGLGIQMALSDVITIIKDEFGNILKSLGLIIVLGTALGLLLEYTGSTTAMAASMLKTLGDRRAPIAMSLTGFIVGLPIFCDSGYIVLSGLNKSIAGRSHTPMAIMSVSLATSLLAVHCLLPPHPGAAAAAGTIGVEFGRLILFGILVAIPAATAGYLWARYAGRGTAVLHARPDEVPEKHSGPVVFLSFLPVATPIVLVALISYFSIELITSLT